MRSVFRKENLRRRAERIGIHAGQHLLVVDNFAGGGGASTGLEIGLGRSVDIAINHNAEAIAVHKINHPTTEHYCEDVWQVDPVAAARGRPVGVAWFSPDCFPAGTLILTENGYKPIEQVSKGELVLTHKGRWRPVTALMQTKKQLIEIKGYGHPGLRVSGEHPFYVRQRKEVWDNSVRQYQPEFSAADWVEAKRLGKGSYWATPVDADALPIPSIEGGAKGISLQVDARLMWLVGRYLGDGWSRLTDTRAELVIICGKHEAKALANTLNQWPRSGARATNGELAWSSRELRTAVQFTTNCRALVTWLRDNFGHRAENKRLPGWALGMSEELRNALLDGYLGADGWTGRDWKGHQIKEAHTVSPALAYGVKSLAATLGFSVLLYKAKNRNTIEGRVVNARSIYQLRWRLETKRRGTFIEGIHRWSPVRENTPSNGVHDVFNLSVEEDESYVAEGIVVHNCTHHSQASGGQPRSKAIRGLAWVATKWAGKVFPMRLMLENVEQILQWGPLVAKRDKETGRVIKLDKTVAAPGERVPVQQQFLVPDKKRKGKTWKAFVRSLEELGYVVEYQSMVAADYGAPTTRDRLFMVARRDGQPIVWPAPTHFKKHENPKMKWRPAAECIDWNIPCPSIFTRRKALADATLRRIARGIQRYVVESGDPFIVPIAHYNGSTVVHDINEPLRTIVSATKGGEFAVAAPVLAKLRGDSSGTRVDEPVPTITSGGNSKRPAGAPHALGIVSPVMVQAGHGEGRPGGVKRWGRGSKGAGEPLGTVVASGGGHALASAYLMQANGGFNTTPGHKATEPMSTITNSGSQQQLVTANMVTLRQNCVGKDAREPVDAITAGGQHHGVVSALLSSYYTDDANRCRSMEDPTATITTENRLGLVAASMVTTGYGEREGQEPRALNIEAPLGTIVAGGGKHALVEAHLEYRLSEEDMVRALRVAEFMHHNSGGTQQAWAVMTVAERLLLVTVNVKGVPHVIVDVGLRMMDPLELLQAQGFPKNYVINRGAGGVIFSKSTQVRLVGNSVSPVIPAALIRANCQDMIVEPNVTLDNWRKVA